MECEVHCEVLWVQGSVFKALWWTFGMTFLFAGLVKIVHDVLQIAGPELLRQLLRHLRDRESACRLFTLNFTVNLCLVCSGVL